MFVYVTGLYTLANTAQEVMTEEQRMEEGRRMFQIFAARMFEQRVLQAYREKVAAERQQRLLEELAEEDEQKDLEEAKKAKEAQKKKEKKDKQKQLKAEQKARKDAEIAAREAEAKAAEDKRLEEQRKKREEQRRKKEAERKAQEEEKQRKETERLKRLQDERDRQQEAERKVREQKALEKKTKDEAKRKEREERETREKEAREKKANEVEARRDRETKAKADKERLRKEEQVAVAAAQNAVSGARKAAQPLAVAMPPQLLKQTSSSGFPSPHVTPAVPKAPTPNRPRQTSHQGSHGSSPKTPHVTLGATKSISPASHSHMPIMPKSILTKPPTSQPSSQPHHGQPMSTLPPIGPPPGMQGPPGLGMSMPPGLNGFSGPGPMMPGMMGRAPPMSFYPPQSGPPNFRPFPPPGMPAGRGYPMDGPPGLGSMPTFGGPSPMPPFNMGMPVHSRQGSGSFDRQSSVESPIAALPAQPIQRPAPIQRPSSVKPSDGSKRHDGTDVDELASHLGSKALLDDEDDISQLLERRASLQPLSSMRNASASFGFPDAPGSLHSTAYTGFGGSTSGSIWGTPPLQQFPSAGAPWGNSPTSGFFSNPLTMSTSRVNERGPNEQRIVWLRRLVCSACKILMLRYPSQDGYIDVAEVHHMVDTMRNSLEPAVSPDEIKEACDIIDSTPTNGGGSLEYKEHAPGRLSHIKFVETASHAPSLGEIGSPLPGHSLPAAPFAGRFPGLGPPGF